MQELHISTRTHKYELGISEPIYRPANQVAADKYKQHSTIKARQANAKWPLVAAGSRFKHRGHHQLPRSSLPEVKNPPL